MKNQTQCIQKSDTTQIRRPIIKSQLAQKNENFQSTRLYLL